MATEQSVGSYVPAKRITIALSSLPSYCYYWLSKTKEFGLIVFLL